MLKKTGFTFVVVGGLICAISTVNIASVMAGTHAKEHKEEEHGMTGAEGEAGREAEKVEHKHKEPKKGTGGEAKTHGEGHKAEDHGMTGSNNK